MYNKNYISVGIDVGSSFSFMTILAPDGSVIQKPFKITHNNKDSLEKAVSAIKKAEELYSLESHTFLESTGIYHFPLFCYLTDCGLHVSIINPIITHSSKNGNIRKVKNDKIDSKGIAKLGLSDDVPVSQFPTKLVLEIRSLTRKYYDLTDERSSHVNKLMGDLHTVFPQYLDIFCDITGKTSTMILRQYGCSHNLRHLCVSFDYRFHRTVDIRSFVAIAEKYSDFVSIIPYFLIASFHAQKR